MKVFNSSIKKPSSLFIHYARNPAVCVARIESIFNYINKIEYSGSWKLTQYLRPNHTTTSELTARDLVEKFACFADKYVIREYELQVENPLWLNDAWDDDPIGSSEEILIKAKMIESHYNELQSILSENARFTNLLTDSNRLDEFVKLSNKTIEKLKKKYKKNKLFQNELNLRKKRSDKLGQKWAYAEFQEYLWLDITFKLRKKAIELGYDVFAYNNVKEGNDDVCYVSLTQEIISFGQVAYKFDIKKYRIDGERLIQEHIDWFLSQPAGKYEYYDFFFGKDPMRFWIDVRN